MNNYKVGDLIVNAKALNVLMILESPHVNEIIHAHPAAGESALELTRLLTRQDYLQDFNPNVPVGCNIKTLQYTPLGILNCSHYPMNPDAYACDLSDEAQSQINDLAALKQQLAQNHTASLTTKDVFQDFTRRLTAVLQVNPNVTIIPCGQTAIGFIDAFSASYDRPLNVIANLPHPTETAWQNVADTDLHTIIDPAMLP